MNKYLKKPVRFMNMLPLNMVYGYIYNRPNLDISIKFKTSTGDEGVCNFIVNNAVEYNSIMYNCKNLFYRFGIFQTECPDYDILDYSTDLKAYLDNTIYCYNNVAYLANEYLINNLNPTIEMDLFYITVKFYDSDAKLLVTSFNIYAQTDIDAKWFVFNRFNLLGFECHSLRIKNRI